MRVLREEECPAFLLAITARLDLRVVKRTAERVERNKFKKIQMCCCASRVLTHHGGTRGCLAALCSDPLPIVLVNRFMVGKSVLSSSCVRGAQNLTGRQVPLRESGESGDGLRGSSPQ